MPLFRIGETEIDYRLLRSESARHARLTATPSGIELVVPETATDAQIEAVLARRKAWIIAQRQAMTAKMAAAPSVHRFTSGAKVPYRGRMARLTVTPFDGSLVDVFFRNGFHVQVPKALAPESSDSMIESALRLWLKKRVREDAQAFIRRHGERTGLKPKSVAIKDQKHMWGSCGQDRIVNLNWQLVFAPKPVLEYAVVHELCHLRHRNHEPEFWSLVASILPDWGQRKSWLDRNEHLLGWRRVEVG